MSVDGSRHRGYISPHANVFAEHDRLKRPRGRFLVPEGYTSLNWKMPENEKEDIALDPCICAKGGRGV
jgi:hypothetical protein